MKLRTPKNLKTVELNISLVQNEESVHLNGVLEKEENLERMEFCLNTLPEEQEKTIRLFYLEGKCYNEIVELTGFEWEKVRSFIQNGRRNLKICMEKSEAGSMKPEMKDFSKSPPRPIDLAGEGI